MESVTCQNQVMSSPTAEQFSDSYICTLKKVTTTQLWSIIFLESWIYIRHVWYNVKACLLVFPLVPHLFWFLHCNVHRVRKWGAMSKKYLKFSMMFCFWRILVRQLRNDWSDTKTWHTTFLQSDQTFHLWHCPQFTHPTHAPAKQS